MPPVNERDHIDHYKAIIHHSSNSLRRDHNSLHASRRNVATLIIQAIIGRIDTSRDEFDTIGGFNNKIVNRILPCTCVLRCEARAAYKMIVSIDALAFYLANATAGATSRSSVRVSLMDSSGHSLADTINVK